MSWDWCFPPVIRETKTPDVTIDKSYLSKHLPLIRKLAGNPAIKKDRYICRAGTVDDDRFPNVPNIVSYTFQTRSGAVDIVVCLDPLKKLMECEVPDW